MSFPRYDSYRDSGVEWLGEVPSHWSVCLLKRTFAEVEYGISDSLDIQGNVAVLRMGNIESGRISFTNLKYVEDVGAAMLLRIDDLLFNRTNSIDQVGKIGRVSDLPDRPVTFASYLVRLRLAADYDPAFISYLLNSSEILGDARARAFVAIGQCNLNPTRYGEITLGLPPIDEQLAISAFLDRETAKIDALVEEQRRLIELLKEKRHAVISHAVTNGLDPTAPMKDSGVEWLGDVPAHWEVSRLSRECSFQSGKAHEPFIDDDGEFIYVSARFVSTAGASARRCTQNLCSTEAGDILMVMSDLPNGRALARAFLVRDDAPYAVNQRVCRVRPLRGDPGYLAFQLDRSPGLLRHDDGMNQTHLSNSDFTTLPILVPPPEEQHAIAVKLEREVAKLDNLAVEAGRAIQLLQERGSALISAAVTGKIDVRGAVAAALEVQAA